MLDIIDIRPEMKDLRSDNYRHCGSAAEIISASDAFGAL